MNNPIFLNGIMGKSKNRIYLVDDDHAYRKSLVRLLTSLGYDVTSFASAQDFLDAISVARELGILILDIRMPNMNGFQLQERMNELGSKMAIIMITADSQSGDQEPALSAGAIGFLHKPFIEDDLLDLIYRAIESSHKVEGEIRR